MGAGAVPKNWPLFGRHVQGISKSSHHALQSGFFDLKWLKVVDSRFYSNKPMIPNFLWTATLYKEDASYFFYRAIVYCSYIAEKAICSEKELSPRKWNNHIREL